MEVILKQRYVNCDNQRHSIATVCMARRISKMKECVNEKAIVHVKMY